MLIIFLTVSFRYIHQVSCLLPSIVISREIWYEDIKQSYLKPQNLVYSDYRRKETQSNNNKKKTCKQISYYTIAYKNLWDVLFKELIFMQHIMTQNTSDNFH